MPIPLTNSSGTFDFDLHGFVRVRLVDAAPRDVAAVRRQLGLPPMEPSGEADITLRFLDRLPLGSTLRLIGLDDAGYTDDAYLVLRGRHKSRMRVQVPVSELGGPCTVICERGLAAVPLLVAMVNLTALHKGYVPVHASAALYRDQGILIAGWAKGGKTELLLGLMADGGRYIGDEWVYISPTGEMFGIPEPMKIWASHLDSMPGYSGRVRNADRLRLRALSATGRATRAAGAATSRSAIGRGLRRAAHLAAQQAYVHVPPATLFGADRCDLHGRLDRTLLAVSIDEPGIELVPIPGSEVAARMRHSIQHERLDLLEQYLKFRFAFPHATNQRIEDAAERTGALLEAALSGRPAAVLRHPYPAPIPEMVEAVRPWLA